MVTKAIVDPRFFNPEAQLPFELRLKDFEVVMQDVYDFFHDVNNFLTGKGLERLDDMLRPANMSGTISDMLTASLAKHSRALVVNAYHNGHPDLVVKGRYPTMPSSPGRKGSRSRARAKEEVLSIRTAPGNNICACSSIKSTTIPSRPWPASRCNSSRSILARWRCPTSEGMSGVNLAPEPLP